MQVAQTNGGTGLGLALCRSLIGLLGGHIAAPEHAGRGQPLLFRVAAALHGPEALP